MNILISRCLIVVSCALALTGCGHRYFHFRATNPLIEDRVTMDNSGQGEMSALNESTEKPLIKDRGGKKKSAKRKMSVLTTRADRRTILVFGVKEVCAEPSPDVAEAIYQQSAAKIASKKINTGINQTMQNAILQLSRRSQGLDYYRSGSFINCLMHYNGVITREEYFNANKDLLEKAVILTIAEIDRLPEIYKSILQVNPPSQSTPNVEMPKSNDAQNK